MTAPLHELLGIPKQVSEPERILALPIDTRDPETELPELVEEWTGRTRRPGGDWNLFPVQALALDVIRSEHGLLGAIGVGRGKSLIALLANQAAGVEAKRTLIILPAQLRKTLVKEAHRYWQHFRFSQDLHIISYNELSDPERGPGLLDRLRPELIIADEAHRLKNMGRARTDRFLYWLTPKPEVMFIPMSGSFTRTSIREYAHIAELALREGSPLPQTWTTLESWSACIDVFSPLRMPRPWDFDLMRDLVSGFGEEEMELKDGQPSRPAAFYMKHGTIAEKMEVTRAAFKQRLISAPGVVQTTSQNVQIALIIDPIETQPPAVMLEALDRARKEMRLPDGGEIDDPLRLAAHEHTLSLGFYYRWVWPGGKVDLAWLEARRHLGREISRATKGQPPGLDTPATITRALEAGTYEDSDLADALVIWRMHEHKPEPPKEAVWLTDWVLETASRIASQKGKPPALVWYLWDAVATRLGRYMQVVRSGFDPPERSNKPCAVSIRAHVEGQNLQYGWSRNVILYPPSAGDVWEQLLGRTHRDPQKADEVWAHVMACTKPAQKALKKARISSEYIASQTQQQKFLLATWTSDRYPVGD